MADETASRKNVPVPLQQLIATTRNDITIANYNTILTPQDDTLIARGGSKGLKIYDEIERDPHAYAVLQKRKLGLIGREWTLEPASGSALDQTGADFIATQLPKLSFDRLCYDFLDATLKGFAVSEIVWERTGTTIVPVKIVTHDQRRFAFDHDWKPRLLTFANMTEGEQLPDKKFIVHRFGVKGNNPYGLGLGSMLFWPALFKREGVAFWMVFLEKFASPTPVGKYPQGTPDNEQRKLLNSLTDMVQSGAVVVPLGSEVNYLEATRAGTASYEDWCLYWDKQMSLGVFGSTLATDTQGAGSRAASETHSDVEQAIIDADADLLASTLQSTLFQWMLDFNMPGAEAPLVRRVRPEDAHQNEKLREAKAKNMALEIKLLFELKGQVPPDKFVAVASQMADEGLLPSISKKLLAEIASLDVPKEAPLAANENKAMFKQAIALALGQGNEGHDHGMDALADQLAAGADPLIEGWLDVIKRELDMAVANGGNALEFSDRLLELAGELSIDPLGNAMAAASEVAELTGRSDVNDEIGKKKKAK